MAERPIEEVIGWHADGAWPVDVNGKWQPCATVDDLAAWLDERMGVEGWDFERADAGWGVYNCATAAVPPRWWHTANIVGWRPTILAALTAAVRKVAGGA